MTKDQAREVVSLYRAGWGARSISRALAVSERSVENLLAGRNHLDITGGRISHGPRPKLELACYAGRRINRIPEASK